MTSKVIYTGNLRTSCVHIKSQSEFETDAPTDNHGLGSRFSPTDLLATSLAACMITVMGIRAEKEGITFNQVEAEVVKVMASNPRRIKTVSIKLVIGDRWLSHEKQLLEEIGRNCPVALSLSDELIQEIEFIYL